MKVLFACVGNSCRSQMAEGFARFIPDNPVDIYSAGSSPSDRVAVEAITVMAEVGLDISDQKPKGMHAFSTHTFDVVITMGCGTLEEAGLSVLARRHESWAIEDPAGHPLKTYRRVRDQIRSAVNTFFRELQATALLGEI